MTNQLAPMAWQDAHKRGLKKYIPLTHCKNGHLAFCYTRSGECTVCLKERRDRWKQKKHARPADKLKEYEVSPHHLCVMIDNASLAPAVLEYVRNANLKYRLEKMQQTQK